MGCGWQLYKLVSLAFLIYDLINFLIPFCAFSSSPMFAILLGNNTYILNWKFVECILYAIKMLTQLHPWPLRIFACLTTITHITTWNQSAFFFWVFTWTLKSTGTEFPLVIILSAYTYSSTRLTTNIWIIITCHTALW